MKIEDYQGEIHGLCWFRDSTTNLCQHREKCVPMNIFTMLLDLAINNAYAIVGALDSMYKTSVGFRKFK
jgi:hypothetical protein